MRKIIMWFVVNNNKKTYKIIYFTKNISPFYYLHKVWE